MLIFALDPGTSETGFVLYDSVAHRVCDGGVEGNSLVLELVKHRGADFLALEMVASYGMPVGKEVFETVWWTGRFTEAWNRPYEVQRIYRKEVCLHLCGSARAKDANVRQALLDLFPRSGGGATPQIGTKAAPGPLYGVSSHAWAALGVALTAAHRMQERRVG